jgi:TRAP-type C4-dicarboxylate transport system substrate-binding protein
MGYGEVFTAIQTGVVDGAENNPPSLYTANHFKAGAKFYTQTNHLIIPEILVMSKVAWDKLSPADQALFKKAWAVRRKWTSASCGTSRGCRKLHRQAQGRGCGVHRDRQQVRFFQATAPVRAKYGAPYADLMNRIAAVR